VGSDSNDARIITVQISVDGGQYNSSVENRTGACDAAGYDLVGVEFAQECCTCFASSLRWAFLS